MTGTANTIDHAMDAGTVLAANRTAMAFSRTAMASDRTLMAVARTSLSFIGFGFTIFQFFHTLNDKYLDGSLPAAAPGRFGISLIVLGIVLLSLGILNRRQEARELRARRQALVDAHLLHHPESKFPSSSMVIAVLLLLLGLLALASVGLRVGPF